jgi:tetraacyldisaccharide 4'-kinase
MRFDQFLYQKKKPFWEKVLLFPLYLFSLPYGGVVRLRAFLYSVGVLETKRLPCPVISIGNMTVGGTGKTPLVMTMARGLVRRGISVAILSRGYKGKNISDPVVSDGQNIFHSPEESGDEPYLLSQSLKGVPVLVGKDRSASAKVALQKFKIEGFLLDDGFQHLSLHRDLNILLIDSRIGFGDLHLLPRGILREPLAQLRRAHLFLLTKAEHPEACQVLETKVRQIHPSAPIFHSHYEPLGLVGPEGEWEALHSLREKKVFVFSGIANPDSFSSLLRKSGMEIVNEAIFPDHHRYTEKDLSSIREKSRGAERVVTTEKDMLKLKDLDLTNLSLRALCIELKIWEEEEFYNRVMEVFQTKSPLTPPLLKGGWGD